MSEEIGAGDSKEARAAIRLIIMRLTASSRTYVNKADW